jgi:hypothetical protein
MAFVHYTVKKIVHGLGAIKEAANEVKNLKGSKAFIVTDPGLAKIGVQKPLEEALTAGGIEWKLYAEAQLEPSMDSIQHCTDEAKAFGADVIIGFGPRHHEGRFRAAFQRRPHRQVLRHQPGSESFPALHPDPHHVRHRL